MPGGSNYQGPANALRLYTVAVSESASGTQVKGNKNPYTSRNGHMFSFLDGDGAMALRLSDALRDEFLTRYESGPVISYGSVVRGYVAIPSELLHNAKELGDWFQKSYTWIGSLKPKATKK